MMHLSLLEWDSLEIMYKILNKQVAINIPPEVVKQSVDR